MPRVNATVQGPLGNPEVEQNPLCASFRQPGMRTVAIVGNGPLNDAQRREIDTFDVVVRCACNQHCLAPYLYLQIPKQHTAWGPTSNSEGPGAQLLRGQL